MVTMLLLILLPVAFLLPPGAGAGEIIGGHEAEPHSRPYMAHLLIQRANKSKCGGFLVKPTVVLTAAHCQGESITVVLGAHNVSQWEPSQQVIPVQRQIPHPQYNRKTLNNDIMILQLGGKACLTRDVQMIRLTSRRRGVKPPTKCSVAGWGRTGLMDRTDILREVNLKVISDEVCREKFSNYVPSSMLCAGDPDDRKLAYMGDSGGPLVCRGVVEGIVSFGDKNSIVPPAVYTRISHFLPWIKATLRGI
ncbi:duodenase-1-like [Pelodiscus sinensis]|uniref:duodenase-1-like n=1 Tax=Pelodiscus sinensis TaxID=13735 RepID=UPI003F6C5910